MPDWADSLGSMPLVSGVEINTFLDTVIPPAPVTVQLRTRSGAWLSGEVRHMGDGRLLSIARPRAEPQPADRLDEHAEARLATLASRLQAILASAVELDASIQDTERIYRTTFENLAAAIPFSTGVIQLLTEDQLQIAATWGFPADSEVNSLAFPLDDRFPNVIVVNSQRALALDDIRVDFPHFLDHEGQYGSSHIRSWLGVPLMDRGTVVGMITMDRSAVDPFDPDEIELAQALANHAAVALSNARMYESLERANQLQNLLLRELHHRVKNSLQLVSSLMSLRMGELDGAAASLVQDLRTHIQALAATHDNIFQPGLSQDVMLSGYLQDVTRSVQLGYGLQERNIQVIIDIPEDTRCPMEMSIPLGLMVSELVLNAAKHAFPQRDRGVITVSVVRADASLQLVVHDDGCGFPEQEPARSGFGLNLVQMLAEQIDAAVGRLSDSSGTNWTIVVPEA